MLEKITIPAFKNSAGTIQDIRFSYRLYGLPLGQAPIVLVNHALSGNAEVTGAKGWWNAVIGPGKSIDTGKYTVLAFNMPGNGFESDLLYNYREFTLRDIAGIYLLALKKLEINSLYAGIGGSVGGALLWEMAVLKPDLFSNIIPVAAHYSASPWLKALCKVQDQILNNSAQPVKDARMQAMTFYRSPQSLQYKFGNSGNGEANRTVEDWLDYHGDSLERRFDPATYKLMNHLLTTTDVSNGTGDHLGAASKIEGAIHIITVNSDLFFLPQDSWDSYVNLSLTKSNVHIHEIRSIHGHDAFLMEYGQLSNFLDPIFNSKQQDNAKDKYNTLRSR